MRESRAYDINYITKESKKYIKKKPNNSLVKGVATIQLFNTSNAELEREIISENLITDFPVKLLFSEFCNNVVRKETKSSWTYPPFNTILLTDYTGPESSENTVRGLPVGFACTSNSAATKSTHRGYYNAGESFLRSETIKKVISVGNKYRWHIVLDFPTHVANGTFQTIYALPNPTVRNGDDIDWVYPASRQITFPASVVEELSIWTESGYSTYTSYSNGTLLACQLKDTKHDSEHNFRYAPWKFATVELTTQKVNTYTVDGSWFPTDIRDSIPKYEASGWRPCYDAVNNLVYMQLKTHDSTDSKFNTYKHLLVVNLNEKKISLFNYGSVLNKFDGNLYSDTYPTLYTKDGYLYMGTYSNTKKDGQKVATTSILLKFDCNGREVCSGTHSVEEYMSNRGYSFCEFGIVDRATFDKGKSMALFDYDCNFQQSLRSNMVLPSHVDNENKMYHYQSNIDAYTPEEFNVYMSSKELQFLSVYFSQIPCSHNRLPAPVTKTAAHTMKIQYDIECTVMNPYVHLHDK